MSFQYSGPGGNLTAGITWMVLIITNSSWVVISEMELPSGCEEVETMKFLSWLVWGNETIMVLNLEIVWEQNCMSAGCSNPEAVWGREEPRTQASRISWDCCAALLRILPTIMQVSVLFSCFTVCTQIWYRWKHEKGTDGSGKEALGCSCFWLLC